MTELVLEPEENRPTAEVWSIPRRVWFILLSWGLAVLVLAGLFSAWTFNNQRQQDHDMCSMISVFLAGPEPVAGPAGDRSRVVRSAMEGYFRTRHCADT